MNWSKIVSLVVFLFAIVGIPIIVNAIGCPELLSYYGGLVGAIVAILFTRKQVQRESFLKNEMDKWTRLKSIFLQILDNINPMTVLKEVACCGISEPAKAIRILRQYQIDCAIEKDLLYAHLSVEDHPKFKDLINDIELFVKESIEISEKMIEQYSNWRILEYKDYETINEMREKKNISDENIIKNMNLTRIKKNIMYSNAESQQIYEDKYRVLLQHVGAKFHELEADTQRQADSMLVFGNIFSSNTYGNQKRTDNHK